MTRNLMHELSISDRFGEFRIWFRMPLLKVEELTDIFINRGYLKPARSLLRGSEFREWSELFISHDCSLLLGDRSFILNLSGVV